MTTSLPAALLANTFTLPDTTMNSESPWSPSLMSTDVLRELADDPGRGNLAQGVLRKRCEGIGVGDALRHGKSLSQPRGEC